MEISGWKYYNFAAFPSTWPHEEANLSPIYDKTIWKLSGSPMLARWTSDWDKKEKSQFYFCIKDDKFEISKVKAKRRYEINKGIKNFTVKIINPQDYIDEIYDVYIESLSGYPNGTVPVSKEHIKDTTSNGWSQEACRFFGVFDKISGQLCGYSDVYIRGRFIPISSLHTRVSREKDGVNLALVNGIVEWFNHLNIENAYLCDGARSVYHQTAFQDFLIKYFNFRRSYCTLNIIYKPYVKPIILILFPFRKLFYKLSVKPARQIAGVLKMEAWKRDLPE